MIISASRRTDIPAFYPEWFMNRIREGYVHVRNPFNTHQVSRVDLSPENVDCLVFWTRDPQPMMPFLAELDCRGYPYYFQITFTGYPKVLEPAAPRADEMFSTFRELSRQIGPERIIWRFDPILLSDVTPEEAIVENFALLARELKGTTRRVVISFLCLYNSVKRTFARLEREKGLRFHDAGATTERVMRIAASLANIARTKSMEIVSCADRYDLASVGIGPGKCIDDELIQRLFGITVSGRKDRYQRKECRCVESKDIGEYNTCTHGCVYCYATFNKDQAERNRARHDPASPFLIGRVKKEE
jgi:hypothetical protein